MTRVPSASSTLEQPSPKDPTMSYSHPGVPAAALSSFAHLSANLYPAASPDLRPSSHGPGAGRPTPVPLTDEERLRRLIESRGPHGLFPGVLP